MNVNLTVYKSGSAHKLTVLARPNIAGVLGEGVLVEGLLLEGLPDQPSAREVLSAAYRAVALVLSQRDGAD